MNMAPDSSRLDDMLASCLSITFSIQNSSFAIVSRDVAKTVPPTLNVMILCLWLTKSANDGDQPRLGTISLLT